MGEKLSTVLNSNEGTTHSYASIGI